MHLPHQEGKYDLAAYHRSAPIAPEMIEDDVKRQAKLKMSLYPILRVRIYPCYSF